MKKITIVEWLPFGQQGLFLIQTPGATPIQLHVENENPDESSFIDLDKEQVQKLINALQESIQEMEVSNV